MLNVHIIYIDIIIFIYIYISSIYLQMKKNEG